MYIRAAPARLRAAPGFAKSCPSACRVTPGIGNRPDFPSERAFAAFRVAGIMCSWSGCSTRFRGLCQRFSPTTAHKTQLHIMAGSAHRPLTRWHEQNIRAERHQQKRNASLQRAVEFRVRSDNCSAGKGSDAVRVGCCIRLPARPGRLPGIAGLGFVGTGAR
jgi:hypothetical protein